MPGHTAPHRQLARAPPVATYICGNNILATKCVAILPPKCSKLLSNDSWFPGCVGACLVREFMPSESARHTGLP